MKLIEILTDIMRVVETISVIHELGFVHNGLTSSNLLKSEKNVRDIKITGWGFAFSFTENCSQGYRNKHSTSPRFNTLHGTRGVGYYKFGCGLSVGLLLVRGNNV